MGDEDAVDATERLWQDLLTEVGATVNEQPCLYGLYKYRAAQPPVARVSTPAGFALAANDGHATRGAST